MALTYRINESNPWPAGWYAGTITDLEEKAGKFDSPVVEFSLRLRRGDEERDLRAFCSVPTSTQSKGYLWYRAVVGQDPPKDTCPLGDLLGLDVEAYLEIVAKDDRKLNRVAALRKPACTSREDDLFDTDDLFAEVD